jgi:hypothetical protein
MTAPLPITTIDPRLAWMAIASARLILFEGGEIAVEEACDGLFDDVTFSFRLACERADAAARKRPVDRKTAWRRQLLASNMSLDSLYRIINSERMS